MKILVTAFEAFNNDNINPSEKILEKIEEEKILLPVSYEFSRKELIKKIKEYEPDFILSLGYAGSRKEISLEKVAYNEMKASIKDNYNVYKDGCMITDGEEKIETLVKIEDLNKYLSKYNTYISLDPGRFICNEVYYTSLLEMNQNSLFVHIPPIKEMKEDGKDLSFLVDAVKDIIKWLKENN